MNRFIVKAFEILCTFVFVFVAVPGEFTYHNFYILAVNFDTHNLIACLRNMITSVLVSSDLWLFFSNVEWMQLVYLCTNTNCISLLEIITIDHSIRIRVIRCQLLCKHLTVLL